MRVVIDTDVSELVLHAGRMRLIDRVLEGDDGSLAAEATIQETDLFYEEGGVGGWVGIELMAQTIGAWAGWQARRRGLSPRMGFLLGTRRYECSRESFLVGERLRIEVRQEYAADNGLGQFDCSISIEGDTVATATLTVFEPPTNETPGKGERR